MTPRIESFETPFPVELACESHRGRVIVRAEETQTTRVELRPLDGDPYTQDLIAAAEVSADGKRVRIFLPREEGILLWGSRASIEVLVTVPVASNARIRVGSASVETEGRLGDVSVRAGSGRVTLQHIADGDVAAGSGEIEIGEADGGCEVKNGSGRVRLGRIAKDARTTTGSGSVTATKVSGHLKVVTGSGRVSVEEAGEGVDLFAASGAIDVRRASRGRVRARTTSGRVTVGVAAGTAAWLDIHTLSGRVHSSLDSVGAPAEGDARVEVLVHTVSGSVHLERAGAPEAA